ncbi:demethylmenaquinone methyltransferase [Bacteroidia bacterium]|nr:demethylmenaquinone methyltransferase [Bacteroidia bacterium]
MTYSVEKIIPYTGKSGAKSVQVEEMFNEIAPKYDLLNRMLSLGIDRFWRKKGIRALQSLAPKKILDVATGTGDLALEACRMLQPDEIRGIDISEQMMNVGKEKVSRARLSEKIRFERQNCDDLQLPDNSFDAAMVAFGVRNFEDLDKGLQEILRILQPGGKLMILELSTPEHFPLKQGYRIYSKLIPLIGKWLSKSNAAYHYLPKSIEAFPQNKTMTSILEKNGFVAVEYHPLTFGICTMYLGSK